MNIFKFPYDIDISEIKTEIENNPNCWNFDTSRKNIYVQRNTDTIPIRAGKLKMGQRLWDSHESYDTVLKPYFPKTNAFIDYFIKLYGGECGRVAIVRLHQGKDVSKHIDVGDYYRKRDRFHLVIDGMYEYEVEGEKNVFSSGELFWFDSQKKHMARNLGLKERIVVIFDVKDSQWRSAFKELNDVTQYSDVCPRND